MLAADPLAASVADLWRGKGLLRAPVVGMATGLRLDPEWASTAVDRLSVGDLPQAEHALSLGLPAECVVPCGIPVCGGFSSVSSDERNELRAHFGLHHATPVVLTVCHGLDLDLLSGALFQLGMIQGGPGPSEEHATLLFDLARHDTAGDLLRRRAALYGVRAQMFGKVNDAAQLWAASTVVVARPHRYVEQRALALRLPLCSLAPVGDAELETARIWVERGIGRIATSVATLGAELELQLEAGALAGAQRTLGEITRRSAAAEVARLVAQVRAESERVLAEVRTREAPPPPVEPTAERGPLEAIGVETDPPPACESLAELEMAEAEANGLVREHHQQAELWQSRAALAEQKGEPGLRAEAEKRVERHRAAMHRALAELARLGERRRRIGTPRAADGRLERSFRELEVEAALAALKRKIQS